MSERLSVGAYSIEITGAGAVVRDQRGAVLETVALDAIDGELVLPDGRGVDLAALLAGGDIADFSTAAGPAGNAVLGIAGYSGPGGFRAFAAASEAFFDQAAGTLGGTSLRYGADLAPGTKPPDEDESGGATPSDLPIDEAPDDPAPFAWSSHDQWQMAENLPGGTLGPLLQGNAEDVAFQVSDPRFDVVDGFLQLKDGVTLDYESEPTINITISATDGDGREIRQTLTLDVTDVNEAPAVSVADGAVKNHIVATATAYQPAGSTAIGDFLLKGGDGANALAKFGAAQVNGIDPANVTLAVPAEVQVTFQREGAGYRNMVGAYQFDDAGKIVPGSVKFIWLDATAIKQGQLGSALAKDFLGFNQATTVSLGTLATGTHLGFFTIADGAGKAVNQTILKDLAGNAPLQADAMAAINGQLSIVVDASGNGHVYAGGKPLAGDTYFTHDKSLNTDFGAGKDIQHALSGISATADGQLIVGFEDLNGGGDRDYEDVVFSVGMGTYNVNRLTQSVVQPSVDFADIDSDSLGHALIHTSGFQPGDVLNVPPSADFEIGIVRNGNDYAITITGKTGGETVDQYESFVNSIYFSTSSQAEGDRHIGYSIADEGGLISNIGDAVIGVANSYEISSSELAPDEHLLGSGDDHLHLNAGLAGALDFGDGHDTLHAARINGDLGHDDFALVANVEAIDTTGFGKNNVALSIADVLDMTDADRHLTVVGDKGDTVTLSGDGSGHHWTVVETGAEFTTYAWSDPVQQAVVEISNQLTANLSN